MMNEQQIIDWWEAHHVFQQSIDQRSPEDAYTFYDGPPFATGLPHYGHLVTSTIKDVIPRYWTMKGKRVERVWGWDCHGLPIENIVEQELKLGSRKEILRYGIEKFNAACRTKVLHYANEWKRTIRRMGRWVDMEHAYTTMDLSYMESVWWVFKRLWEKGLIYEGRKSMHICPRCETVLSNFEVTQGYKEIDDLAITPLFTITSGRFAGNKIAAWTTTAWTLPGNVLLAVRPDQLYVLATIAAEGQPVDVILAKERLAVMQSNGLNVLALKEEFPASALVGAMYEPLLPIFANHPHAFRIVAAPFVTIEEGTGVVHIAPGFGEDDMILGRQEGVDPIIHVTMNGQFIPDVVQWFQSVGVNLSNVQAKPNDEPWYTDGLIAAYLKDAGKLLDRGTVTHSYPHCWRCDTPLLNYTANSWFVNVTERKEQLVANNQLIHWVPEHMKDGRFGRWLEGARDWAISRSRYWGTPLPIWKSEDGDVLCMGSIEELERLSGATVNDLHKDVVDAIVIQKDGKAYRRINEVLDCWFESGSMPYAQWHYPFENKERFEKNFPAEFIGEGQDQTRGWFYTLHVLSTALFGKTAFRNVIVNGIVLSEDGKKMSKRLKNYPEPEAIIDRYGADALRMYLCLSPVMEAENLNFSEKGVDEVYKKITLLTTNVLNFWSLYKESSDTHAPTDAPESPYVLDQWIVALTHELIGNVTSAMDAYELARATRPIPEFIDELSTWYVRRSRDRFKGVNPPHPNPLPEGERELYGSPDSLPKWREDSTEDKERATQTLGWVLRQLALVLAPFMPMLAESMWQELSSSSREQEARSNSVHLENWPAREARQTNRGTVGQWNRRTEEQKSVIERMKTTREIVSMALQQRAEAGLKIRQPLSKLTIQGNLPEVYLTLIRDEVNVKEVIIDPMLTEKTKLDTTITDELKVQGLVRDLIRAINAQRKKEGLTIGEFADATIASNDPAVEEVVKQFEDDIKSATFTKNIRVQLSGSPLQVTLKQESASSRKP